MRHFVQVVIFIVIWLLLFVPGQTKAQAVIIGQPADTSVCIGGNAHFSVLAVNAVSFQWQENDGIDWYNITAAITYAEGFTTPLLKINDANLGLNGYKYRCVVKDSQNLNTISNAAKLGVHEPPIITQNPTDQTVCKNELATFNISALYADSYQWQESVGSGWINITDDAFYSGSTTPTLKIFTTTGMNGFRYRCRVVNGNCPGISAFARLLVNPSPALQNVTGGGSICAGDQGLPIGLSSSESSISYHLYRNESPTGIVVTGSGQTLSFGLFAQAGTYSVVGINGSTGCSIPMLNTAKIIVNPLPQTQQVLGGGSYCDGSIAPEILLSSSESGIKYQLLKNGVQTGLELQGTNFVLNFGPQPETGFYTVVAINPLTLCSTQMLGNAQIIKNMLPVVMAGPDQSIAQGSQAILSGQVNGSSTYLFNWQPAAYFQNPHQAAAQTIPLYQTRLFTFTAKDLTSQCQSLPDSVKVVVTGGPLQLNLSATQNALCPGTTVFIASNASGGTGVYSYNWTSSPPGFTSSQADINVIPTETTTYTLSIRDGNATLTKSITLTVHELPNSFNLTGGGNYCSGKTGLPIGLQGSQQGSTYQLFRNGIYILSKNGNGSPLTFGQFSEGGNFSVEATLAAGGCRATMPGTATITEYQSPLADAGPEQLIQQGETALLQGSASSGTGSYSYLWSPSQHLINPTSAQAATLPLFSTKQFQLFVSDLNSGCISNPAQTVVFVSGSPVLQLQIQASSFTICSGESVQLTALVSGGTGNYQFNWSSQPPGFNSTVFNPIVSPVTTTTYIVTVSDGLLSATSQLSITVRPKPQLFDVLGGGSYCAGGAGLEVSLSDSEPQNYYSLLKDGIETGLIRQGTGDLLNFGLQHENGYYEVKAFSPIHLCESRMQGYAEIITQPLPVVDAGLDATIPYNSSVSLSATASGGSGNYSYRWQPEYLVLNPNAASSLSVPLIETRVFYAQATDLASGCASLPDQKKVFVSGSALNAQIIAASNSICLGETLSLEAIASGGTGNYSYYWTSDPPGFFSNEALLNIQPTQNTIFHLSVNDGMQSTSTTFALNVKPLPQLFPVTGGGNLCNPDSHLTVGLSGSENGTLYQLFINNSPQTTFVGTGSAMTFGLFNGNGQYTVNARNPRHNCSTWMEGQAVITSSGNVVAEAGPDKTVIQGGQALLEGQIVGEAGAYTYSWSPAHLLVNPQQLQPLTKPLHQTTIFRLVASGSQASCAPSVDFVTVFVQGSPLQLNIMASDTLICPGQPVQLISLAIGGSGTYTYSWTSEPPGHSSSLANPVFYPTGPTLFKLTVTDGNQLASKSISIYINSQPTLYQLSGGGSYCNPGETVQIQLSGSQANHSYRLFKDNLPTPYTLAGNGNPLYFEIAAVSGVFTVEATNSYQCSRKMDGLATIALHALPIVVAGPNQQILAGNTAFVQAEVGGSQGPFAWHWEPEAFLVNPNAQTTSTLPLTESKLFRVTATDNTNGCQSKADTTFVIVTGNTLHVSILAASATVCKSSELKLTALASGGSGNYNFLWKDPDGILIGTQQNIVFNATKSGIYTVNVVDGASVTTDDIAISLLESPQTFNFSGGGYLCQEGSGLTGVLAGSESGVEYRLMWNDTYLAEVKYGTGYRLTFNNLTQEGHYTIYAHKAETSCMLLMPGEAFVNQPGAITLGLAELQTVWKGQQAELSASIEGGSGNFSFMWEPSEWVVQPQALATNSLPLVENKVFTLTATDQTTGCSASKQQIVLVQNSSLNLQLFTEQTTICPHDEVRLFALVSGTSNAVTYQWASNPPGFQSNIFNPLVAPAVATTYYVTVSNGIFYKTDSILINVKPAPAVYLVSGGGNICSGTATVSVELSGSQAGVDYTLMRNGYSTNQVIQGNGQALNFSDLSEPGLFAIKAQMQQSGCTSLMSGNVVANLYPSPIVNAGNDQQILLGEVAILEGEIYGGSAYYNFYWNPSYLTLSPHTAITPTLPLYESTVFFLHGSDQQSGCTSAADTTLIIVSGGPLGVNIIPNPANLCQGESILLTAIPGGGNGNYSYVWRNANGEIIGEGQHLSITPETSTDISVELTDGQSFAQKQTHLNVIEPPQTFHITGGGAICNNSFDIEIGLELSETQTAYSLYRNQSQYLLTMLGTGEALAFGKFLQSGVYTVKATTNSQSCEAMMAGTAVIQQYTPLIVDAGPDRVIGFDGTVQLECSVFGGSGYYSYNWQPAEKLQNPSAAQPLSHPLENSTMFTVEVTDMESGCKTSDEVYIFVNDGNLNVSLSAYPQAVCPAKAVYCSAIPSGGSGNYSWWWNIDETKTNPAGANLIVYPEASQWVKVTVNDGFSSVSDSIWIEVYNRPEIYTVFGGGGWCDENSIPQIILSGSSPTDQYLVYKNGYFTGQIVAGSGTSLSISPTGQSGQYTILARNSNSCESLMEGSATITHLAQIQVFSFTGGGVWCPEDPSVGFLLSGSEKNNIYQLILNGNEIVGTYGGTGYPISLHPPSQSGLYSMKAIHPGSNCGAEMQGTASALFYPKPNAAITGPDLACYGETISLTASGGNAYDWLTNPPEQGEYYIFDAFASTGIGLRALNDFGCSDTTFHLVEVVPLPEFEIIADSIERKISVISDTHHPSYRFYCGEELLAESPQPYYQYGYTVFPSDSIRVQVISQNGCVSEKKVFVPGMHSAEITINAFSPNSDQINDRFMAGEYIRIFNRWGLEIFAGNEGWNGRYKGALVAPGTYYYIVELHDINGKVVRSVKGSVTLVIE